MSINDPNETAKKPTETAPEHDERSSLSPSDPLAVILHEIRALGSRLTHLEERFDYLDRDVLKAIDAESIAATDAEPEPPRVPSMAMTSDGRPLVSVAFFQGVDISDRTTWTGVYLSEAEGFDALDGLADGADDVAARVAGAILKASKKAAGGGSDEDG